MTKPFSQACENNKAPILGVLKRAFANASHVLEIGSGTGQHAVHFAQHLPHLIWHTSDMAVNLDGINAWLREAQLPNLRSPLSLQIGKDAFPVRSFDAIFSANTAHIMFADEVAAMMASIADTLPAGGVFCQYGPFTSNGQFSSQSNQSFHQQLLARGLGGYKDIESLQQWAGDNLTLHETLPMPANNLLLIWQK